MQIINTRRAFRFDDLLRTYDFNDPESTGTGQLIDLLRDARHWCHLNGHDLGRLDRMAHLLYLSDIDVGGQP